MLSTRETNWFPQCLLRMGKEKNRSRLTWIKSPKIEEKSRKTRRKETVTHLQKKTCFHFDHLLCEFATIPFNTTESNYFWAGASKGAERTWYWQGSVFVWSWGCWLSLRAELVFRSGARKTLLKCPHICSMTLALDALYWLQPPSDLFPRKDCLHEILLGMNAVSSMHQGQQPLDFKGSSSQASANRAVSSACPQRSVSKKGTMTCLGSCIGESKSWFPATICSLCGDGQWGLLP